MNHKSQLRGWAIDRAIEAAKVTGDKPSLQDIMTNATVLMEYAYIPREDLESTAKDLFDLVRKAPANEASIDALIGTLEHIREDRMREGIDADPHSKVVKMEAH